MLALLTLSLVLAACAQPAPTVAPTSQPIAATQAPAPAEPTAAPKPTATPKPSREPAALTMWVYLTDPELAALNSVLEGWKAKTGDTVTVVNYPYFDMLNKVEVAFPAGEGPDLLEAPHTNTGVWGKAGLIAPFPEGVLSAEERAQYQPSALQAFTFGGKLYGIPQIPDTVVLMYNKALLPEPPKTMDELIEKAKALTKDGTYGFLVLDNNMWFGWPFVGGYGGYIFGATSNGYDAKDIGLASKGAADGLSYLLKLRNEYKLIPADLDWNVLTGKFTEGKVAAIVMNPNQYSVYKQAKVDVGMAVLPKLPNGEMPRPLLNVHGWAINGYSKKQQAAAELAVYLGANLPVPLFKAGAGNIPVRLDAAKDPAIASNADAAAAAQQVGFAQAVPNIPEMAQVWAPADSAFQLAAKGDKTPMQALQEAADAIGKAIASQQ
jgi:arabinogalactan oligomer/maltooligosaccharide transport system substrate-binding protein